MTSESASELAADRIIAVLPVFHRAILHPVAEQSGRRAMEFRVLRMLSEYGELGMSRISRYLAISKPYLTAIVDALIAEGHVERRQDPFDRRAVRIAMTPAGERHLENGIAFFRQNLLDRLAVLDEAEIVLISDSMENLARILARVGTEPERSS